MVREARVLSAHKINVVDGKIVINLYDEQLEIEYADVAGQPDADEILPRTRADLICSALHILLCYSHKRKLDRRSSYPASLNSKAYV